MLLSGSLDDKAATAVLPVVTDSLLAASKANAAERRVLLAQPKKARHFLRSIQTRAKTDALDSHGIGLFALCRQSQLPSYPLKSLAVEQLEQFPARALRERLSSA